MSNGTEELTIDGLAHRVGMTVRNVRAYQSRGLIPPPRLKGRTGYYGPQHVARLELIRDLQAEGFNLASIKRVLERVPGDSVGDVLDFARAVRHRSATSSRAWRRPTSWWSAGATR